MLNEARKEEVLELAKVLISQQSYSGHEGGVAAELEKYMKANGFDDVTVGIRNTLAQRTRRTDCEASVRTGFAMTPLTRGAV